MKVGIDISSLHEMSKGRGIGFYIRYLIESLKRYTDTEVVVFETTEKNEKVDLVHFPFFDFFRPTLKVSTDIPAVITIHDVIPLLFPKHYPQGLKGRINLFRQKQALKKVKAVITDSEASTRDVIKIFKLPQIRVNTIYLAPADYFKKLPEPEIKKRINKFKLPEKYILYSGGVNWNKNLLAQTNAASRTGLDIVFVGGGFENRSNLDHAELNEFKKFLSEYEKNPQVHILGYVSDEELAGLVNGAQALLFASRYEGFGLPILEAQACGTPVLAGKTSSMIEVAGNGAEFVNPDSEEDIKLGLNKILNDSKNKRGLITRGFENLKRFSWEKTALETVKVYQDALS